MGGGVKVKKAGVVEIRKAFIFLGIDYPARSYLSEASAELRGVLYSF